MDIPGDPPFIELSDCADVAAQNARLAQFRQRHWIARSARGYEILTYDMCERVLRDPAWIQGVSENLKKYGVRVPGGAQGRTLSRTEGGEHERLRRIVQPWFAPRRLDELRARTADLAARLVDAAGSGRCDFHRDIARRIPPRVFCWMVGADEGDADRIGAWSESAIKAFDAQPEEFAEIGAAIAELARFVGELVERKRRAPGDDLISHLLGATRDGTLTERDVGSLALEMLGASSDNTAHTASMTMYLLCRNPDQYAALAADRTLVPGAIEESMRILPRVRALFDINPAPAEIGGIDFPAMSSVYLQFASANRDPAVFEDPDRFDVTRRPARPHLNFGLGRHVCLGAGLARMELQELLRVVLDRWRSVELTAEPRIRLLDDMAVHEMPVAMRRH